MEVQYIILLEIVALATSLCEQTMNYSALIAVIIGSLMIGFAGGMLAMHPDLHPELCQRHQ